MVLLAGTGTTPLLIELDRQTDVLVEKGYPALAAVAARRIG